MCGVNRTLLLLHHQNVLHGRIEGCGCSKGKRGGGVLTE